jgi:hypothetical protein
MVAPDGRVVLQDVDPMDIIVDTEVEWRYDGNHGLSPSKVCLGGPNLH